MITNITADLPPRKNTSRRNNGRATARTVVVARQLDEDELERWLSDCAALLAEHLAGAA